MDRQKRGTVFFDMGNVLIFFDLKKMYTQIGALVGCGAEEIRQRLHEYTEIFVKYEKGYATNSDIHRLFTDIKQSPLALHQLLHAICDIFEPNHSLIPLLQRLKQRGHRLIIVSNTNIAHFTFIQTRYPEMLTYFDDYVLSYRIGAIKPEAAIFHHALTKANCDVSDCLFTDDIPQFIQAAIDLGLPAVLFATPNALEQELIMRGFL